LSLLAAWAELLGGVTADGLEGGEDVLVRGAVGGEIEADAGGRVLEGKPAIGVGGEVVGGVVRDVGAAAGAVHAAQDAAEDTLLTFEDCYLVAILPGDDGMVGAVGEGEGAFGQKRRCGRRGQAAGRPIAAMPIERASTAPTAISGRWGPEADGLEACGTVEISVQAVTAVALL